MKKLFTLFILLASLTFCAASCSHDTADPADPADPSYTADDTDTGTEDAAETEPTLTKEEARAIFKEIITPTQKDAFILNDDYYYTNRELGRTVDFYAKKVDDERHSLTYMSDLDGENETVACFKEGCAHNDMTCPAYTPYAWLIVQPEGSDEIVAYYVHNFKNQSSNIGSINVNPGIDACLFEYNITKGIRRCISTDILTSDQVDAYCNGFIYSNPADSTAHFSDDGMEYTVTYTMKYLKCINTATCETRILEENGEPLHVFMLGMYEGRVYSIDDSGNLYSCAPDLSEYEFVRCIDEEYTFPVGPRNVGHGYIRDNILLLLIKDHSVPLEDVSAGDYDLYRIDLSDGESEPELVKKHVNYMSVVYEHIYYASADFTEWYEYYPEANESVLLPERPKIE